VSEDERAIPVDRGLVFAMVWTMTLLGLLYAVASVAGAAVIVVFFVAWMGKVWGLLVAAAVLAGLVNVVRKRRVTAPGAPSTPEDHPVLHTTVERLCARLDLPKPAVQVVPADAPNALAVGLPKRTVLCVTEGMLARLDAVELEAAVAHELSHVAHRDTAVMTLACSVGIIGEYVSAGFRRQLREAAWVKDKIGAALIGVLPIAAGWLLYAVSVLLSRRLSRYRELAADRAAAYLTGRPSALASALVKCSDDAARIPMKDLRAPRTVNALCLMPTPERDFRRHPAHPPLRERIDRLAEISRRLDGE